MALYLVVTHMYDVTKSLREEGGFSEIGINNLTRAVHKLAIFINLDLDTNAWLDGGRKADDIDHAAIPDMLIKELGMTSTNLAEIHKQTLRDIKWLENFTLEGLATYHNLFEEKVYEIGKGLPNLEILDIYLENIPMILGNYIKETTQCRDLRPRTEHLDKNVLLTELQKMLKDAQKAHTQELQEMDTAPRVSLLGSRMNTHTPARRRTRPRQGIRGGENTQEPESSDDDDTSPNTDEIYMNDATRREPCATCGGKHHESTCWSITSRSSRIPYPIRFIKRQPICWKNIHSGGIQPSLYRIMEENPVRGQDGQEYRIQRHDEESLKEIWKDALTHFGKKIERCNNPRCVLNTWDAKTELPSGMARAVFDRNSGTGCPSMIIFNDILQNLGKRNPLQASLQQRTLDQVSMFQAEDYERNMLNMPEDTRDGGQDPNNL